MIIRFIHKEPEFLYAPAPDDLRRAEKTGGIHYYILGYCQLTFHRHPSKNYEKRAKKFPTSI